MLMSRVMLVLLVVNIAIGLGGIALNYSLLKGSPLAGEATAEGAAGDAAPAARERVEYTFFPIEKIIVNLQDKEREYYLVLDLVLQAAKETDPKKLGQIDPMVRNSVVAHLSSMDYGTVRGLSIPALQAMLEKALQADFTSRNLEQPFAHVLVSKLIVQ